MKKRTVIVTLEIETDEPLSMLKDRGNWNDYLPESVQVQQVEVNVVKKEKTK